MKRDNKKEIRYCSKFTPPCQAVTERRMSRMYLTKASHLRRQFLGVVTPELMIPDQPDPKQIPPISFPSFERGTDTFPIKRKGRYKCSPIYPRRSLTAIRRPQGPCVTITLGTALVMAIQVIYNATHPLGGLGRSLISRTSPIHLPYSS
ncbi:hypothetical protein BCR39DRAFT_60290 [Naematelia encephala]|uniref:Uncharacterized protein n=1 Tax=Naematelia encephala TaxID=71784 RepID=A0A1Y2BBQ4_9TREE|nr:hypothetical protein BCR39DRAFT_60290 [Naematelia encephala]